MRREPPEYVKRQLRHEVGFGCPVPGCGNPYLEWHHFDPPWHLRQHHDPAGMIALCGIHHNQADAGAFTNPQLHQFKLGGANRTSVAGKLNWMRIYHKTPVVLRFRGEPVIYFKRDSEGYLLLNLLMLTTSREPRAVIKDNFWLSVGRPKDLECPPSGKLLRVRYSNGDMVKVEFHEIASAEALARRYPGTQPGDWPLVFPITAVEVQNTVAGTNIKFGPRKTQIDGTTIVVSFMSNCGTGIAFG